MVKITVHYKTGFVDYYYNVKRFHANNVKRFHANNEILRITYQNDYKIINMDRIEMLDIETE